MLLASRLKIMLADLGLNPESAGKMLHVQPRTIRYWISGKPLIPYAAYEMLKDRPGIRTLARRQVREPVALVSRIIKISI